MRSVVGSAMRTKLTMPCALLVLRHHGTAQRKAQRSRRDSNQRQIDYRLCRALRVQPKAHRAPSHDPFGRVHVARATLGCRGAACSVKAGLATTDTMQTRPCSSDERRLVGLEVDQLARRQVQCGQREMVWPLETREGAGKPRACIHAELARGAAARCRRLLGLAPAGVKEKASPEERRLLMRAR